MNVAPTRSSTRLGPELFQAAGALPGLRTRRWCGPCYTALAARDVPGRACADLQIAPVGESMLHCPSCAAPVAQGATVCRGCGAAIKITTALVSVPRALPAWR